MDEIFCLKKKSFYDKHEIDVPNMIAPYTAGKGRSRHQKDLITIEHHFQVFFFATINSQLQELNNRFREDMVELLALFTFRSSR